MKNAVQEAREAWKNLEAELSTAEGKLKIARESRRRQG